MPSLRVVGPGRAGTAIARGLAGAGGTVAAPLGRGDDVRGAAHGIDLVIVSTPDDVVAEVAAAIEPARAVVVHLAGSLGLDVLRTHSRTGSLHPLRSIPTSDTSLVGAWFAVAGDP